MIESRAAPPSEGDDQSAGQLFELLVDSVRDYAIFMLDPEGRVVTWNAGAERIKGYQAAEIIGRHFSVFYPAQDRADKPALELRVARDSGRFEEEGWRLRKDGSRFWANVVISCVRARDGSMLGFSKVTRDLTHRRERDEALRRSEARVAAIIGSAMDAIISVDEEQRVVVFNSAAETMFRCPARDALGQPLEGFVAEPFRNAHAEGLRAFARTGVVTPPTWAPGTRWGRRADGEEFPIEAAISLVTSGDQRIITLIVRDTTDRLRAEKALTDALEAAQHANRAKSDFLAMISHELRTPLNAIAGYVQIIEMGLRGPLTEDQQHDVRRIKGNQQHLLKLIDGVLNFARIEAGHLEYRMVDLAVHEMLVEVHTLLQPQLEAKGIAYSYEEGEQDVRIVADADKVRQIVVNLLANAVKFTPAGGRITLACGVAGSRVSITVRDTGIGIAPEKLEAVFEPFFQLERNHTRGAEGVGLGLAISRELAQGMGGALQCSSQPGEGSVFTLLMPRAPGDPDGYIASPAGA